MYRALASDRTTTSAAPTTGPTTPTRGMPGRCSLTHPESAPALRTSACPTRGYLLLCLHPPGDVSPHPCALSDCVCDEPPPPPTEQWNDNAYTPSTLARTSRVGRTWCMTHGA